MIKYAMYVGFAVIVIFSIIYVYNKVADYFVKNVSDKIDKLSETSEHTEPQWEIIKNMSFEDSSKKDNTQLKSSVLDVQ